ncbi:MAG: STAS/SEC14 domain-containing protein [Minicystis sp.]
MISTRTAHLWIDDDLIVHCDCLPGFDTTKADAVAIAAATWKVAGERRRPGLVDIRSSRSIDRAARAHFSGPACARTNAAVALVIGSPLSRMVGNFFIGLNKPLFPTRLFTLEADAHTWLRGFLE